MVAIEILDQALKTLVETGGAAMVTIPVTAENELESIIENANQKSPNNKWGLPVSASDGQVISVSDSQSPVTGRIKVTAEIYFNKNDDLKK